MTGNHTPGEQVKRTQGFSLIEVLIALIVMSVGMLGIAGLYVHGMQAGRTSLFRHHAVTLAGDVADRIRANPDAGAAYIDAGVAPPPGTDCIDSGVNCSAAQMAANDMYLWDQQAAATVPNGDVRVTYNNGAVPSVYTVTINWNEAGDNPSYQITFPVFEM